MNGSYFLQGVHHAYAQTDGTYAWPNSREGDLLRAAKAEIEVLRAAVLCFRRAYGIESAPAPVEEIERKDLCSP